MTKMTLEGKRILLGVSGSIAAYKAADLCSQLSKSGAEVHVVLTENAERFIGVPTFRALSRNPVLSGVFEEPQAERIAHIDLAQSADLVIVAPATANLIAKMAHGIADDLVSTCLLAVPPKTPLLIAPAMNTAMWEHPATQANLQTLKDRGVEIVEPGVGLLACLDFGAGKLAGVEEIFQSIITRMYQKQDFAGKRVLVTAGATREPLDPVRFLSNRSSGKMGFAVAIAAKARGAQVTLIAGFTTAAPPAGVELVRVENAQEMLRACEANFPLSDVLIAAAAVADYSPETVSAQKIKKPDVRAEEDIVTLRLKRTPHIVSILAGRKCAGQIVVAFAAETGDALENAQKKPYYHDLDLVAVNDVTQPGAGFDVETNLITLLSPDGRVEKLPLLSKRDAADRILDRVSEISEFSKG